MKLRLAEGIRAFGSTRAKARSNRGGVLRFISARSLLSIQATRAKRRNMVAGAVSGSAATGSQDIPETEAGEAGGDGWTLLVRQLLRIRFLQRLWGQLGNHLKSAFPQQLRDDLRRHFP